MDGYSRLIAWLKVLLPLAALGILSTLFLLSRGADPGGVIPFAEKEIRDRVAGQQVTEPFFSGATLSGDKITLRAKTLRSDPSQAGVTRADEIWAQLDIMSGQRITLQAQVGEISVPGARAVLDGDVALANNDGVELTSDRIEVALDRLEITSPGPIHGRALFGTLTAGTLSVTNNHTPRFVFTNGVKLIYEPEGMDK